MNLFTGSQPIEWQPIETIHAWSSWFLTIVREPAGTVHCQQAVAADSRFEQWPVAGLAKRIGKSQEDEAIA